MPFLSRFQNTFLYGFILIFALADEISDDVFDYVPWVPKDPIVNLSLENKNKTIQAHAEKLSMIKIRLPEEESYGTGFNFNDVIGILSWGYHSAHTVSTSAQIVPNDNTSLMGIPSYRITTDVVEAIYYAARKTGVPPGLLFAFASKESNFIADASSSTSSAQGLFQHVKRTWRNSIKYLGPKYGYDNDAQKIGGKGTNTFFKTNRDARDILEMRDDPKHASVMTAALLLDNKWRAEKKLGRTLKIREFYMTHFLGVTAAVNLIKAYERYPNRAVNKFKELKKPIKANKSVFIKKGRYKTVAQVMAWFQSQMDHRIAYFSEKFPEY